MSASMPIAEQTIVAVYDTQAHAELAVEDLLAAKVPANAIERHTEAGTYAGGVAEPVKKPGGFMSSLFGSDTHADAGAYASTMSKGGTVVTVHGIPHADFDAVAAILEKHGPIEFDDEAAASTTTTTMAAPVAARAAPVTGGDTLRLSEESLVVGKQVVNRGSTRIRRYVVETPVEQQVSLHDERVTIDRRVVTDGRAVDATAFTGGDKTIEMMATAEQAVVGKTSRVVEEIGLRREGVDRTKTVRDTVRKEEVEIEKVPGEPVNAGTTTTGTTTTRPARKI